jgi:DNA mismatch endonuclease (patch repair protein)
MRANRRRDTSPEIALRSELHRRGRRFRVDFRVPGSGARRRVDVAFPRLKIAVFVDGCYWHSCPTHGTLPKTNREFWTTKFSRNRQRDRQTDQELERLGWRAVRVWEHESVLEACNRIEAVLAQSGWETERIRERGAETPGSAI